jgi:AsmA protein
VIEMRKIVLIVVAAIVLVIVAAPFLIPVVVDLNSYKPRIAEAVREATGRELVIGGEISYSLLPAIEVSLGDVRLSNAPGMPTPEMLSLGSFSARVALWPLISREVVVESLIIEEPSLFLEVSEDGRPNWAFESAAAAQPEVPAEAGEPPQINDIRLGDVRLERGLVSYIDARSGQAIQARDINLTITLADIMSALNVNARVIVNEEPVTAEVHLDSPAQVLAGERFAITAAVRSERISAGVEGKVQQAPVPGFDGAISLDVDSVGALMAWLQQPLDESQPDPGPLKVRARLAADGARVALEEATIEGAALEATAKGSFDGSGEVAVVALEIESGVLDIDRYLPPPAATPAAPQAEAPAKGAGGPPANPLAALSDEALDLSPLRQTKADVKVRIGGVKAAGFELGRVALAAALDGGVLAVDLAELGLYGGKVAGKVRLDGSGQALGAAVDLEVDKVNVGRLARAATGGEAPVAGVASGTLKASASGASPRALAEALKARLVVDLGGVDVKDAPAGAISALAVDLDLPGLETPMTLEGSVVYNKERVDLDLTLDPLKKILSADRFGVAAAVKSRLLSAAYKGDVQQRPAPGLDGSLDLDVGSVGKLAAWLGQPLDAKQPDPGPLKVRASFAAEGERVALKEATIQGTELEAKASGSYEKGAEVDKVVLNLRTGVLDIDRYLPPPAEAEAAAPAEAQAGPPADLLAALSDEPLDLSALKRTEAEVRAGIGGVKAMGYQLGEVQFSAVLKDGELVADLAKLVLYGGGVAGKVRLDASGEVPRAALAFNVKGVDVGALARAAMGGEAPLAGIADGTLDATTTGASPRALVEGLKGKLAFSLGGVDVKDAPGAITQIAVDLDLPGLESPPSLKGSVTYNQEQVAVDLTLDPLKKVLAGERFALKAALNSNLVTAAYDGSVQQRPTPGLDGGLNLDVGSVGKLAAWLGQPLDPAQPDPGPLKVQASFETQGAKATLKGQRARGAPAGGRGQHRRARPRRLPAAPGGGAAGASGGGGGAVPGLEHRALRPDAAEEAQRRSPHRYRAGQGPRPGDRKEPHHRGAQGRGAQRHGGGAAARRGQGGRRPGAQRRGRGRRPLLSDQRRRGAGQAGAEGACRQRSAQRQDDGGDPRRGEGPQPARGGLDLERRRQHQVPRRRPRGHQPGCRPAQGQDPGLRRGRRPAPEDRFRRAWWHLRHHQRGHRQPRLPDAGAPGAGARRRSGADAAAHRGLPGRGQAGGQPRRPGGRGFPRRPAHPDPRHRHLGQPLVQRRLGERVPAGGAGPRAPGQHAVRSQGHGRGLRGQAADSQPAGRRRGRRGGRRGRRAQGPARGLRGRPGRGADREAARHRGAAPPARATGDRRRRAACGSARPGQDAQGPVRRRLEPGRRRRPVTRGA